MHGLLSPAFVCLSVWLSVHKITARIWMKFSDTVGTVLGQGQEQVIQFWQLSGTPSGICMGTVALWPWWRSAPPVLF